MSEPTRKWYNWYSPEDTPEERKLITKLDLLIVPYAFTVYWVNTSTREILVRLPASPAADSPLVTASNMYYRQRIRFWHGY